MSVLVVVPLVVLWHLHPRLRWNWPQALEFAAMLLLLVVMSASVFGAGEVAHDVTEQVRAEERLRQSEERLRLAQTRVTVGSGTGICKRGS